MHPLNDDLPGPYVPGRIARCALVAHRYTYAPPRAEPRSTAGLLFSSHLKLQERVVYGPRF